MVLSFIGMLSVGTNQASAAAMNFKTEDGKYDNWITTTSYRNDVEVIVYRNQVIGGWPLMRTDGYGAAPAYPSQLQVRLCNSSTWACTGWKSFSPYGDGWVKFYDMKVGTFAVDIRDNISGQWVYGTNNTYTR